MDKNAAMVDQSAGHHQRQKLIALDGKVSFDDNALFRHADVQQMRDLHEEDPLEIEAGK
jgi:succinyl-CoA synthetase beta subunit